MIPTKNPIQKPGTAFVHRWLRLSHATCSWRSPGRFAMFWNGCGTASVEF
jgi:hypothetical protein